MITNKWISLRKMGKLKFALIYGAFFWGCICGSAFITPLILNNKINNIFLVLIYYIVWIVGGYFVGRYIWEKQEKKFKNK